MFHGNSTGGSLRHYLLIGLCVFGVCLSATMIVSVDSVPLEQQSDEDSNLIEYKSQNYPSDEMNEQLIERLLAQEENCCNQQYFEDLNWAIVLTNPSKDELNARAIAKLKSTFLSCKETFEEAARKIVTELEPMEVAKVMQLVEAVESKLRARPEPRTKQSDEWTSWRRESLVEGVLDFMSIPNGKKPLDQKAFREKFQQSVGYQCAYVRSKIAPSVGIIGMYLGREDVVKGVNQMALYWARASKLCSLIGIQDVGELYKAYKQAGTFEPANSAGGQKCANSKIGRWLCPVGSC